MKKAKSVLWFVLGAVLGASGMIAAYVATKDNALWQTYIETELLPCAVLALSAIGGLCFAAQPILKKVGTVLSLWDKATADVNATAAGNREMKLKMEEQDEKIADMHQRFDHLEAVFTDGVSSLSQTSKNTEQIARIGFGNMDELVKKGYAKEIGKIGKKEET